MKNAIRILKSIILIATMVIALLAILYVLDVFPSEMLKDAILKTIAVMGILTGASLIVILLTANKDDK